MTLSHVTHLEVSLEPLLHRQHSLSEQRLLGIQHLSQELNQGSWSERSGGRKEGREGRKWGRGGKEEGRGGEGGRKGGGEGREGGRKGGRGGGREGRKGGREKRKKIEELLEGDGVRGSASDLPTPSVGESWKRRSIFVRQLSA